MCNEHVSTTNTVGNKRNKCRSVDVHSALFVPTAQEKIRKLQLLRLVDDRLFKIFGISFFRILGVKLPEIHESS